MNVFSYSSYKKVIQDNVLERKNLFGADSVDFQSLAKAMRVQKTYLSRVLNGDEAHLSADQLFLALEFLRFSEPETEFIQMLHELERSQVSGRKKKLEAKIRAVRERENRSEHHLKTKNVEPQIGPQAGYYMDINLQLLHMFLTIQRFSVDHQTLQSTLGYSASQFERLLGTLKQLGLIEFQGKKINVTSDHLHLPSTSPLNRTYQIMSRLKVIESIHGFRHSDDYHFNVFLSANEEIRLEVQNLFYTFLKETEKRVRSCSKPEDVYQIAFDLIRWT